MAELQQLGALDPAAQEKLMADLRATDPAIWPLVVQQFRAALAYRRRLQEPSGTNTGGPKAGLPPRLGHLPPAEGAALPPHDAPQGNYPATGYPPLGALAATADPQAKQPATGENAVVAASHNAPAPGNWQDQVESAARELASKTADSPSSPEEIARQIRLRMLYLLAGRRDDALEPIPAMAAPMQDFWSKQLYALWKSLDTQGAADGPRRAAEAKQILDEAVAKLGESAPLEVCNLTLCKSIDGYGCIAAFEKDEFLPGQEVLLYAEVKNFTSEQTAKGHHTILRSSCQLFDSRGQRVVEHDCPETEEYCQNVRHDFFVGIRIVLPEKCIYPGRHTLQLTIEDLKSHKLGQASIPLTIKSP